MRLVFFTDVHAHVDWNAPTALARAARAINAEKPGLVIGGGDLIYDGFETTAATADPQWDVYMEMHRSISARVEPVLGNHDLVAVRPEDGTEPSADPRSVFRSRFGLDRTWRVIDSKGYRFFLLDSIEISDDELMYHGGISTEQLSWLASELGRTDTDTPLVLVTHIPLLSAIPQATKGAITPLEANHLVVNNREVLELFAEHNLLLVLQGHLHAEEMLRWRDTTFVTCGAICGNKWRGPRYGTPEGFGVVTLKSNRVDWKYKSYGWEAERT
jgi:3',5'-cyclic AMP phosphodiesterase CpdA